MIDVEQIAPTVFILRHIPRGVYGDPYDWTCILQIEDDVPTLKAATGKFSKAIWREVQNTLYHMGFDSYCAMRHGRLRTFEVKQR